MRFSEILKKIYFLSVAFNYGAYRLENRKFETFLILSAPHGQCDCVVYALNNHQTRSRYVALRV